jgi:hypothetical protein
LRQRLIAYPVNDPPDEWWYVKSKEAPGPSNLPPVVVLFKIVSEPGGAEPGVIEGQEAWWDDNLVEALLRRVRQQPSI